MEPSLIYEPRKGYQSHYVAQANGRPQDGVLAQEFQVLHPIPVQHTVMKLDSLLRARGGSTSIWHRRALDALSSAADTQAQ
jgi:hypothetical protein